VQVANSSDNMEGVISIADGGASDGDLGFPTTSNTSDTGSYNYFNEMWEKSWTIGVELFKAYVETIQKFTGQWPTFCKK
ncbi:hypothetical protein LCGC14_2506730, partial [marine sediment metagenome]